MQGRQLKTVVGYACIFIVWLKTKISCLLIFEVLIVFIANLKQKTFKNTENFILSYSRNVRTLTLKNMYDIPLKITVNIIERNKDNTIVCLFNIHSSAKFCQNVGNIAFKIWTCVKCYQKIIRYRL